jgi:hypothetical protein
MTYSAPTVTDSVATSYPVVLLSQIGEDAVAGVTAG